jgi:hypothetical protein
MYERDDVQRRSAMGPQPVRPAHVEDLCWERSDGELCSTVRAARKGFAWRTSTPGWTS